MRKKEDACIASFHTTFKWFIFAQMFHVKLLYV
jgi:hypothetical protein